jgi:hypothetical protein
MAELSLEGCPLEELRLETVNDNIAAVNGTGNMVAWGVVLVE